MEGNSFQSAKSEMSKDSQKLEEISKAVSYKLKHADTSRESLLGLIEQYNSDFDTAFELAQKYLERSTQRKEYDEFLAEQNSQLRDKVLEMNFKLNELEKNMNLKQEKVEKLYSELYETEKSNMQAESRNRRLRRDLNKALKEVEAKEALIKDYELEKKELYYYKEEVHNSMKQKIENCKLKLQKNKDTNKVLSSKIPELENSLLLIKSKYESLKTSKSKLEKRYNDLVGIYQTILQENQRLKSELRESSGTVNRLKVHQKALEKECEKLRDELMLDQELNIDDNHNYEQQNNESNNAVFWICSKSSRSQQLSTVKSSEISIHATKPKESFSMCTQETEYEEPVDVIYEYFHLTCQAVKLNSKYCNHIEYMPVDDLYQEVIKRCIPFNQWYRFVKDYLNSAIKSF